MPLFTELPPLSLYVHIPWCVQKCPYCDFNSHAIKNELPETAYVDALLLELKQQLPLVKDRPLISIFFGGGTPSLFSGNAIQRILQGVAGQLPFARDIEITLEANPGTVDQQHFIAFRQAGINRLSLGIQSLQNDKLKTLGRIHDRDNAMRAVELAKEAGFDNFNLDIMYGLPKQSMNDAVADIKSVLSFQPSHFSWYQLTLEPNTLFYQRPPPLPPDDLLWEMQLAGQAVIQAAGLQQYEVSAYARPGKQCSHNLNYWQFGDYLGIGAGAHSKITDIQKNHVIRFSQKKHPRLYLENTKNPDWENEGWRILSEKDLIFEFMLNALRLTDGVPIAFFCQRTGLSISHIHTLIDKGIKQGLLLDIPECITPSSQGKRFLNDLIMLFLPN